jgi:hypothetical protein
MSRATTLYVLDVSPRISAEEAKNVTNSARYAIESKLSFTPTDEVGLVFVGTAETHNALHEQCGAQYEHITIAQELLPSASAGVKVLRALLAPPVRQSGADLFMALVTAVHMLRERIDKRRKKAGDVHRVMLATSGMEPLDLPDDKALDEVASMCKEYDMYVLVSGPPLPHSPPLLGCARLLSRPRLQARPAAPLRGFRRTRPGCSHTRGSREGHRARPLRTPPSALRPPQHRDRAHVWHRRGRAGVHARAGREALDAPDAHRAARAAGRAHPLR